MFPVMLSVRGRRCLVVGGGGVALRKVEGLLAEGADVTVVAPVPVPPLEELARQERIELERRPYRSGEGSGYVLVFAATDDREANREISAEAERCGVWANVADDPELCSFHLPARVQRGSLQLAVASNGEAPFATRRLRQLLQRRFGPEWAEWLEAAGRLRSRVRSLGVAQDAQERLYDRFFAATVDGDRLKARVPTGVEIGKWLDEIGIGTAAPETAMVGNQGGGREPGGVRPGLVSLVGAGPGDAGLLTLRGRARLLAADAVVYDRLAETVLPCDLTATTELRCVGKEAGSHPVPQDEINELLVRLAREGKRVVRLKGGDPYVFGRGGEEAEALCAAGVPFEVVPGVTSGIAAPAYAGIPVTARKEAVRVTLLTAHECSKDGGSQVRWELMAQDPHATIVGYMGVTALPNVVRSLVAAGMSGDTPAALIERGTTSAQRTVRATLTELPAEVERAGLGAPALFVIGPTAAHASCLDWFTLRPLYGQRLVLTEASRPLAEQLDLAGAEVVLVPLPLTPASRIVIGALPLTGCLAQTPTELDVLEEERDALGWNNSVRVWCVGEVVSKRARERGWQGVHEVPPHDPIASLVEAVSSERTKSATR